MSKSRSRIERRTTKMKLSRIGSLAILSGFWLCLFTQVTVAQVPPPSMPCSGANLVDQKFPTVGPEVTHWRLCWQAVNGNGLLIHWAYFRTAPTAPWLFLLWDARVSEIFVPYHTGSPRFYDVGYMFPLTPIGAADCPTSLGGTETDVVIARRSGVVRHEDLRHPRV